MTERGSLRVELSRPPDRHRLFALDAPNRVVLDLYGPLPQAAGAGSHPVGQAGIARVRVGRHPDRLRIVADLEEAPEDYALEKNGRSVAVLLGAGAAPATERVVYRGPDVVPTAAVPARAPAPIPPPVEAVLAEVSPEPVLRVQGIHLTKRGWQRALVFDLSRPPEGYRLFMLEKPSRVVIDLYGRSPQAPRTKRIPVGKADIASVRVGAHPEKLRIVTDLNGPPGDCTLRVEDRSVTALLGASEAPVTERVIYDHSAPEIPPVVPTVPAEGPARAMFLRALPFPQPRRFFRTPPFRVGRWERTLEFVVDYSREETGTDGSEGTTESWSTEERLTLRNSGAYLYDPRLLRISAGGTFGLSQAEITTDSRSDSRDGTLVGYDVLARFLPEQDFGLDVFANRLDSLVPQLLAGRTDITTENRGVRLTARRLYIPSTVTLRQESLDVESRTGDFLTRDEEKRSIITYEGRRGWTNSEVDLHYEYIDDEDEVFPRLGYRIHEGIARFSRDFGPEVNRRWDSRMHYFDRKGVTDLTDQTTATIDEILRIDHTDRLQTDYRYFFLHTAVPGGTTNTHTGEANVNHWLYESLNTSAGLNATHESLPGGETDTYRSRADFDYTKRLPRDGWLRAGLGGGFEYEDDRFEEPESFTAEEIHVVSTPIALPIRLDNPFVVESSVVVRKNELGPLPPGCLAPVGPRPIFLVLDRDYTLRTTGDITEIVPIPCTGATPGINPGDTIAVDYRFAVPADLSFTTATWHGNISVDYGWIRPFFRHRQREQHLVSGVDEEFLDDLRDDTVGIEFRHEGRRLRASLLTEAERYVSDRLTFDALRGTQYASIPILRELTLTLTGSQSRVDFEDPSRRTDTLTGRGTLSYALDATLFADAGGGIQVLEDSEFPREQTLEGTLRVRWRRGQLEVRPTVQYFDRERGDTNTRDFGVIVYAIRRF